MPILTSGAVVAISMAVSLSIFTVYVIVDVLSPKGDNSEEKYYREKARLRWG